MSKYSRTTFNRKLPFFRVLIFHSVVEKAEPSFSIEECFLTLAIPWDSDPKISTTSLPGYGIHDAYLVHGRKTGLYAGSSMMNVTPSIRQ